MKFFHVTGLNIITSDEGIHSSKSYNGKDPMKILKCMAEISEATARKYIKEDTYERVILCDIVHNIREAHRCNIKNIYKIWKEHHPCNILYTGPDMLFLKDVSFSDKFDKFSMFNYNWPELKTKNFGFELYFACDIRYYPHSMSQSIWDIALEMEKEWPPFGTPEGWEYEGLISNMMLWSQDDIKIKDTYYPSYTYHYKETNIEEMDILNEQKLVNAHIISLHGSRISQVYNKLKYLSDSMLLDKDLFKKFEAVKREYE